MLGEYKVGRCSRKCFGENRPLREGEVYFSVLIENRDGFERRDYSVDAWEGPPDGCVGHWKCRMPESGERELVLAPREVLIDLLRQMESAEPDPTTAKLRYLLALLLLRRRMVRLTASKQPADESDQETTWMDIEVPHDGSIIRIAECRVSKHETETLTASLHEMLYCEPGDEEDETVVDAESSSQSPNKADDG